MKARYPFAIKVVMRVTRRSISVVLVIEPP